MLSERPVTPAKASVGIPHSGPCTRGNNIKNTTISGTDCASITAEVRSCVCNCTR